MSEELDRRLSDLAAAGEQAGLPAGPDVVRGRARRRQQRRRAMSGGALAALVIGVAAAVASGSGGGGGGGGQKVNVGGGSTTIVTPTTVRGVTTPTVLPPDGPLVADHSKLSALTFDSPHLGYALTSNPAHLARTQDGGVTWHLVGPSQPFGALSESRLLVSGQVVYAWNPGLFVSHDGGASWRGPAKNHLVVQDVGLALDRVWAVGTPGPDQCGSSVAPCPVTVVTSDDRGATWFSTPAPPDAVGPFATITPLDKVRAFVASFSSAGSADLHLTTDGGNTWQHPSDPCQTGDVVFQQVVAVTTADLWLACAGSPATIQQGKQVYRSADGGQHWNLVASVGYGSDTGSITLSGHVNRLVVASDTQAWMALDRIGILVTTDGGRTWREAFSVQPDGGPVEITVWEGTKNVWAVAGQAVWRTTDGVTWTKL